MKKPTPKRDPKSKGETGGAWTNTTIGKALDVAKGGMSSIGSLADWGKEVQRTKQVEINAEAKKFEAREKTTQTLIDAEVKMTSIHRDHFKDQMDHLSDMERLKNQRESDAALARQRDRVLDKLLDSPGDGTPQLADSLRTLLPNGDQK